MSHLATAPRGSTAASPAKKSRQLFILPPSRPMVPPLQPTTPHPAGVLCCQESCPPGGVMPLQESPSPGFLPRSLQEPLAVPLLHVALTNRASPAAFDHAAPGTAGALLPCHQLSTRASTMTGAPLGRHTSIGRLIALQMANRGASIGEGFRLFSFPAPHLL
jgi:hypothetical protein